MRVEDEVSERLLSRNGVLIGPRTVATAGHCVYLKSAGGWAESIEVIPGCNGTTRPFGTATSTNFRSVSGWVTGSVPSSDYGCIVLPNGAFGGRNIGSFGFAAWSAPEILALPAVVAGYPGDKPFAELWGMARRIKAVRQYKCVTTSTLWAGRVVLRSMSSAAANATSWASIITEARR